VLSVKYGMKCYEAILSILNVNTDKVRSEEGTHRIYLASSTRRAASTSACFLGTIAA
jgi:hypothetical protein